MSEPFLGEIKILGFGFPPSGWALCNGQLLPINQNQALFSILGTTYGGDGITTFALPNLQARMPVHSGNGLSTGNVGGEAAHTLTINEIPAHTHQAQGQTTASIGGTSPIGALWASGTTQIFAATPDTTMAGLAVGTAGSDQPHENQAPYLVLNFVVALRGIFPTRP